MRILVSRAGICLFLSVKMAADSIISCRDNERVYLSIVICTVFYIATWPPCAKSLPLSFSCKESDHSQITQFCCRLAGSPFILNQDKIHFEEILHSHIFKVLCLVSLTCKQWLRPERLFALSTSSQESALSL